MNANHENLVPAGPDPRQVVKKYNLKATLRELGLKAVIEHKNHLIMTNVDGLINLPTTLKNILIKMATEEFEQRRISTTNKSHCASEELCTFLATLINSEITSLKIPPLSTTQMDCDFKRVAQFCNHLLSAAGKAQLSPEEFNKTFRGVPMLLDAIGTKCPTLKSLHMLPLQYYRTFIPLMKDNILGDSYFKGVLPRLTVLKMRCYECDDWALMQIATHASSLVMLEVGLSSVVSSKGFEALSELHHLEQFIFADDECRNQSDWKLDSKFLLLSAKILPHLKVAGRHFDFLRVDIDAMYSNDFNCIPGYHNEMLQNLHEPATLNLQLLSLRKDFLPNENIKFPLLEELMLWSPSSRTISVCDRFATVPAIGLYDCRGLDVLPVLWHVGQRLHSLVLDNFQESTSLAEVLRLCPNLKRFRVSNTNVNKEAGPWPEASFWCMEEAYFENATLPNSFLKQVFQSATKLRKLSLVFCNMLIPKMKELTQLAQQKPILPSITEIEYHEDEDVRYSTEVNQEVCDLFFKTLREKCPHLV